MSARPLAANETYKDRAVFLTKRSRARSGRLVPAHRILVAAEEPVDGWLPVFYKEIVEYVPLDRVEPFLRLFTREDAG